MKLRNRLSKKILRREISNADANLLTGFEKATNAVNHFMDKR